METQAQKMNRFVDDATKDKQTFYKDCSAEKIDELVTYNHLKYGFSVLTTELLMKMSKDASEYLANRDASISLDNTFVKMGVSN